MKPAKSFANQASLESLALPAHDALLAGDALTSIVLNFEWRKIIAAALEYYFSHSETTLGLANDDLLNNLFIDLYNAEIIGIAMPEQIISVPLTSDWTTTSLTFVAITDTRYSYTPTKPNIKLEVYNLTLVQSGAAAWVEAQIIFGSYLPTSRANARMVGTTPRELQTMAIFEGVTVGLLRDFHIHWKVSGGTATVDKDQWLIYKITEWD